jgi:sorting nexin-29
MRCRIKIQNNFSEQFETAVGLRQGGALSCILFNLALEEAVRDSKRVTKGITFKIPRYFLMQMI